MSQQRPSCELFALDGAATITFIHPISELFKSSANVYHATRTEIGNCCCCRVEAGFTERKAVVPASKTRDVQINPFQIPS